MDFVHDRLANGRKPRVLMVVDTFSRFSPATDPRFSYRSEDAVQIFDRVCAEVGYPAPIRRVVSSSRAISICGPAPEV